MLDTSTLKVLPLPFLVSGLAALLFSSLAISSVQLLHWMGGSSEDVYAVAVQETVPVSAANSDLAANAPVPGPSRCEECGVVYSTRQVAATDNSPLLYEITLRMRNGSMRVVSDPKPASLRPGERIILISGLNPPGR